MRHARENTLDSLDEELEMELDDQRMDGILAELGEHPNIETLVRQTYFRELFRLQGELVKLQDWVVHRKLKLVVIFEGRDAATDEEQHLRFQMRIHDPLKQWKLSPMDLESRRLWKQYTKAKESMIERTHIPESRWWVVEAVDKKRARLNCIHHLLSLIPYQEVPHAKVTLPARVHNSDYLRGPIPQEMYVPSIY